MTRDLQVYVDDILESLLKIQSYIEGLDADVFFANTQVQDAVIRRLEIVGEAAKNVPESVRHAHPDIPWRRIAGLRDVLIHDYSGVSMSRIWKVAKENVETLRQQMERVRNDLATETDE
jgi:uncharacterized protein with HEPN domain